MNLQELMMMRGGSPTGGMLPQGNNILPPQAGTEHLFPPFVNGIRPADMGVLNQGGSLMNPMQPQPPRNIQPPQMPMPPRIPPEGFGQMNRQEGMALQPTQPLQPSIQNRSMDMFREMNRMPEGNYQQRIQRQGLPRLGPDELFRQMRRQGAVGGLLDPRR